MISHLLVRQAIITRVAALDSIRDSSPYDQRAEQIDEMPFASLWRVRTGPPSGETPEFGHYDVTADWVVRVYIQENSDVDSEATADAVTEELLDAFTDTTLDVDSTLFRVDVVLPGDATVDDRGGSPRLLVVEAQLTTALTTTH